MNRSYGYEGQYFVSAMLLVLDELGLLLPRPETAAARRARLDAESRRLNDLDPWAIGACGLLSDAERLAAAEPGRGGG